MGDAIFEDPRLAEIYDPVDDAGRTSTRTSSWWRSSRSVLDVGCGTGTLACMRAARGKDVTAIDPSVASLVVAGRKPHAEKVRWLRAEASDLPQVRVDLVVMTGNVAQVVHR